MNNKHLYVAAIVLGLVFLAAIVLACAAPDVFTVAAKLVWSG